jgi:uncharacterized protein
MAATMARQTGFQTIRNQRSPPMDDKTRTEVEAAAFRRLLEHLDSRKDVQNIDLMNLAGFCRNCLSKWYSAAAHERGESVDYEAAREIVYGMPYSEWKQRYQREASADQLAAFDRARPRDH